MIDDAHHEPGRWICSRHGCHVVSTIDTPMGGMCIEHSSPLMFAIQQPYERDSSRLPDSQLVPWEFMAPHEKQARANHGGQTLARLSERGGLSIGEALAVVKNRECYQMDRAVAVKQFAELLAAWRKSR